jgi:hypothetical protein
MSELKAMFERQAEWQRSRAKLTWTEKLRMAAKLRDVALSMRPPAGRRGKVTAFAEPRAKYGR